MVVAHNLGFPRIGAQRELKKAVEAFWKGNLSEQQLQDEAKRIRKTNWEAQKQAGIAQIPSNDFSFYDHILDTLAHVGAVPARYNHAGGNVNLDTYFAMARGKQAGGVDVTAMEMSKWFDTNYHYLVPEYHAGQNFALSSTKIVDEFLEAKALGITTKPVIIGPVTLLLIGKSRDENFNPLSLLQYLLPVYAEIFKKLESAGAQWIQVDEPALVLDLAPDALKAYETAYAELRKASGLKILLATYFEGLRENGKVAYQLPVDAIHIDLVRAPAELEPALNQLPADKILSVGVVDGRNIWKTDLNEALKKVQQAVAKLGKDRVWVAASCSLLHSPVDLDNEKKLDGELKNWLAFATQKLTEIALLANAANGNKNEVVFADNAKAIEARRTSTRIHNKDVKARAAAVSDADKDRGKPYSERAVVQQKLLNLPLLPTTTIGSFPQTNEVRSARAKFKAGEIDAAQYQQFLEEETTRTIRIQEELGIDVLVHGEFERNDMVEYFGEQLAGFTFSQNGWVQSYGSRCVKPPIIFGDVSRPKAMTVEWAKYAQSQTKQIMKGMLTGPVTILQWSFVRDDQPRSETCKQIALAIRDEVVDLEKAGIKIIQIDEAAIREGLPLRAKDRHAYLQWAVEAFRISASGVKPETQVHTHMCYSEFNDIIDAVAAMDADVISIETSRSAMELLDAFVQFKYPNDIGPGVYDIHSPRVPKPEEMTALLHKALKVLKPEQVWVNPDCGLKTRGWPEVKDSLKRMVEVTKALRTELAAKGTTAKTA